LPPSKIGWAREGIDRALRALRRPKHVLGCPNGLRAPLGFRKAKGETPTPTAPAFDFVVQTPAGEVDVRVDYEEPIEGPEGLRKATVELAQKARAAIRDLSRF
jgi:hypothetical protein